MRNYSTRPPENQAQTGFIAGIAPQIIAEVGCTLMADRPIHTDSETEIRFGNTGALRINKLFGAFKDYKTGVGGGLLALICHINGYDEERIAFDWLQQQGFLDGSFSPPPRPRPKIRHKQQSTSSDMLKVGQKLWEESEAVSYTQSHPVRRWCLRRNLLPGFKEIPPAIRWHKQKSRIVVALAPVTDFVDAYPDLPEPRQFHLISIDSEGRKGKAFNGDDKRTYGQPGVTCVALFGDPDADQINICEGIADALATLSSQTGAVIASLTTFHKIVNCQALIRHLTADGRSVHIFPDNDEAGMTAQVKLASALHEQGGTVFVTESPTAKDPAAEAEGRAK